MAIAESTPVQERLKSVKRTLFNGRLPGVTKIQASEQSFTLADFIDQSLRASSIDDIYALCERVKRSYNFSIFGLGMLVPLSRDTNFYHLYDDCAWNEEYIQQNLIVKDPFVAHCGGQCTPLVWNYKRVRRVSDHLIPSEKNPVMQLAQDFGLKNTIALPLHGPHGVLSGMKLSATESLQQNDIDVILPMLVSCGQYIYEALYRIASQSQPEADQAQLTRREREVLNWAAIGKNSWETSQILAISENTVNTHLKRIFKKLNVHNRQHAVAKAISQRLILI